MTRIGLISDTHGWLDEMVFEHFKECDEVWHAGDFGGAPPILRGEGKAPPILPPIGGEGKVGDRLEDGKTEKNLTLVPSPNGEGGLGDRLGDGKTEKNMTRGEGEGEEAPPILPRGEGNLGDRLGDGSEGQNLTLVPSPNGEGGLGDRLGDGLEDGKGITQRYGDLFVAKFEKLFGRKIIFRGVYGNIDTAELRMVYPEKLFFTVEGVNVFMQHIGGYPGRYSKGVKEDIVAHKSNLFISGHSHILKIMYDQKLHCLHMNPGAAGKQGWHKMRTVIRFAIDGKEMKNCEVVELGLRGAVGS